MFIESRIGNVRKSTLGSRLRQGAGRGLWEEGEGEQFEKPPTNKKLQKSDGLAGQHACKKLVVCKKTTNIYKKNNNRRLQKQVTAQLTCLMQF